MSTYLRTYIPRGVNAPRPQDVKSEEFYAINARHAAKRAAAWERRSGNVVLTVKEKKT